MLTYIFQSVSQTKPNEANQLCNNFCFLNPIYFYTTEELDRDKYFGSLYITWLFELVISYFWKHIPFHCFAPSRWSNLLHLLRSSVCTILPKEWFYSLESLQHTVFAHVPCQPADSRYHLWSRGTTITTASRVTHSPVLGIINGASDTRCCDPVVRNLLHIIHSHCLTDCWSQW